MAQTKKFAIANLVPDKEYAIQMRAIDNGESSVWSRKFGFTTIDDFHQFHNAPGVVTTPAATTLISWFTNNAGFNAVWNAVTVMSAGNPTVIEHYDMEMTDATSGQTYIFKYYTNSKPTVAITFPLTVMKGFFGGSMPGNVTLRVRAVNTQGNMSDWSNALVCSMGIPDPPTAAVVVEAIDQIKISWTPPANMNFVDGYRVYTGNTAGFTPSAANKIYEGSAATFAYTTTTYSLQYFKIRSYNFSGTESTDLAASGTPKSPFTLDVSPPSVPVLSGNLSPGGVVPRNAELAWTFNAGTPGNEDIAGFVVSWRKVGASLWFQNYFSSELRTGTIELPQPYADYEFKIASYDKVGNYSAYGTILSLGGAIPGPPAQVTGVASTASLDSFRITWTPNTEGDVVNGGVYNVDIATNSGFTIGLQSYTTGASEITISGLLPGTVYYYRVRAVDVGGTAGTYSATGNRTTPDYAPAKSDGAAPASSPTPSVIQGIGYLTALWTRITNNDLVTYDVHMSTTTGFTPSASTLVTSTTATSTIIKTLPPSQTPLAYATNYYVKIVARDADGSAAASGQAGPVQSQQAGNADVSDVSAGKLTAGSVTAGTITIAAGGSLTTANGDVTITNLGITVGANSNISAAAMQAGTAFVDDLTISSNFTIGTSGVMKSANYAPGTTGWQLTNTAFDMRSGTVAAGTLVAGTITSSGISIGAGGGLTVDSTGYIQSNNYALNTSGWRISSTGIVMNDVNSQISVAALKTGTVAATTITIGSGGAIRSSDFNGTTLGYQLDNQGFVMYAGTIKGAAVYTNQLASLTTDPNSPLPPIAGQSQGASFGINAAGKAVLSGALIYGNTVLGTGSAHQVASGNYSAGSAGWIIRGDGYAEFANLAIYGSAKVANQLSSTTQPGWILNADGSASFNNGSIITGNVGAGTTWLVSAGGNAQFRIYPAGQTPGVSSTFHFMRPNGNSLEIHGAFGAAVDLHSALDTGMPYVGVVNNIVQLAVNCHVNNMLTVGNQLRTGAGGAYFGGGIEINGNVASSSLSGDPQFNWIQPGEARVLQTGASGYISACSFRPGQVQLTSSARYKKNIVNLSYTKEQILSLRPVEFEYNADLVAAQQQEPGRHPGFVAEEVEAAGLDTLIWRNKAGQPDGFKYGNFVAALLKVAKEQQDEIDDLRQRLETAGF